MLKPIDKVDEYDWPEIEEVLLDISEISEEDIKHQLEVDYEYL